MSLITEQIEELRQYASERKGEIADICNRAADTLELLSAKLPIYLYSEAEIQKMQELEQAEIEKAYELGSMEHETCENAISRQAVFDIVDSYSESQSNVEDVTQDIISDIMALSSVKQESKRGHWIKMPLIEAGQTYSHECSLCGRRILVTDIGLSEFPYCHCGAKMQEVEE